LLQPGGAQAGKTVRLVGPLPAQEFFLRQLVALTGFLAREHPVGDGGHDRSLAADGPPPDIGRRQVTERTRSLSHGGMVQGSPDRKNCNRAAPPLGRQLRSHLRIDP